MSRGTLRGVVGGCMCFVVAAVIVTMWVEVLLGLGVGVAYMVAFSTLAWRRRESELAWLMVGLLALGAAAIAATAWVSSTRVLVVMVFALVGAILTEVLAPASWRPPTSTLSSRRMATLDLGGEIEVQGWEEWAATHALEVVAEAADPGNPGQVLTLLSVPAEYGPWRVVEATDGTSGERVGLVVDARHRDPVTAVAATYGVDAETYRATVART